MPTVSGLQRGLEPAREYRGHELDRPLAETRGRIAVVVAVRVVDRLVLSARCGFDGDGSRRPRETLALRGDRALSASWRVL